MPAKPVSNYRWTIVALLFFATSINYIDRQVISLLKPTLEKEFNWNEKDYGYIVMAFQASYALGLFLFGRLIDRIGTKAGYLLSIVSWSIAAMLHGVAKTTAGFTMARIGLGLGESGNFPAAVKAVAEWFPKKERALATGIFNSGTNIGAMIAPILIPLILGAWGWQEAFVITGALGFVWMIFWIRYYEIPSRQKRLSKEEFDYIHSDDPDADRAQRVSWSTLFRFRQTWTFIVGKFFTDPIWWFFLFWLPDFFSGKFQIDLKKPGWPLVIVYSATSIGSIFGGYLSGYFIKKGWSIYRARKTAMFIFAICVIPIVFAQYASSMWVVVALISLSAAAHQAWSANIYTTASDMFPKRTVSSIIGIGGMAGAAGGILFPLIVGNVLEYFKELGDKNAGYNIIFIICGTTYMFAWMMMHLLSPKMKKVAI